MMKVEEGWRKVPVGKSWRDRALAVIHRRKGVRTIVEWQMDILFHRDRDAKGARLLAWNRSIAGSFSSRGQHHEGWRSKRVWQIGRALHLEGCPVEVHVWAVEGLRKDFRRRRKRFLLREGKDNTQ